MKVCKWCKKPPPERSCPGCGKKFTPTRCNQESCKPGCRVKKLRKTKRKPRKD